MGPLLLLLWTSGDVFPGFQIQGESLACMQFLPTSRRRAVQPSLFDLLTFSIPQCARQCAIKFFTNYTKMPILAFVFLLRENKKKSSDKMLPPVGIEPGPLIASDSKSNTLLSTLT